MKTPFPELLTSDGYPISADEPRAACAGMPRLFESLDPRDHQQAAAICAECPIRLSCARHTAACLADESYGLGVHGTWNGQLYKYGRAITRVPRGAK